MSHWYYRKDLTPDYECGRILEAFDAAGETAIIVTPDDIDIIVTRNDPKSLRYQGKSIDLPKTVLPRTGSGTSYYSNGVLTHLEHLGIPVVNTARSIELAKDKMVSTQLMALHGLPVPKTMLVKFPVNLDLVERQLGFPCVVKVLSGSYGRGIYLAETRRSLEDVMDFVLSLGSSLSIIIQEYIGSRPGEDLRVVVIGGEVIGAMKRKSADGSFKANITRGGTGRSYPLDEDIIYLSRTSAHTLGLEIAGVDLLFDGNGYKICEVNSAPGFEGFERYTGIDVASRIVKHCCHRVKY